MNASVCKFSESKCHPFRKKSTFSKSIICVYELTKPKVITDVTQILPEQKKKKTDSTESQEKLTELL